MTFQEIDQKIKTKNKNKEKMEEVQVQDDEQKQVEEEEERKQVQVQDDEQKQVEEEEIQDEQKPLEEDAILGIDLGSSSMTVSLSRGASFPVLVRNSVSQLTTETVISYAERERIVGGGAVSHVVLHPRQTLYHVKALLDFDGDAQKRGYAFQCVESSGDSVAIANEALIRLDGERTLSAVQVTATLLARLQRYAAVDELAWRNDELDVPATVDERTVRRAVVALPNGASDAFRRAVCAAGAVVGMHIDTVDEGYAAALCFTRARSETATATTTSAQQESAEAASSSSGQYVLFVDVGAVFSNLTLARIDGPESVEVVRSVSARIGGADIDGALFEHFCADFKERYSLDVRGSDKASAKLRKAASRLKELLSTVPSNSLEIESLLDDVDVSVPTFTRAQMDDVTRSTIDRFAALVGQLLEASPVAVDQITCELLGAGLIMPSLQAVLRDRFGLTLHRHLDSKTSVAVGAALYRKSSDGDDNDDDDAVAQLVERFADAERAMIAVDDAERARCSALNDFESYIYKQREWVRSADYGGDDADALLAKLSECEEWLLYTDESGQMSAEQLEARRSEFDASLGAAFVEWRNAQLEAKRVADEQEALARASHMPERRNKLEQPRTNPERIAAAQHRKQQGNTAITDGDHRTAVLRYKQALEVLADCSSSELSDEQSTEVSLLKLTLNLNCAMACAEFDNGQRKAANHATKALEINGDAHKHGVIYTIKALHRRARAHLKLKQTQQAHDDLSRAVQLEPDSKPLRASLAHVDKILARQAREQQQMYQNMFK
jgi:molecular chaperone DnaK (HSP70)